MQRNPYEEDGYQLMHVLLQLDHPPSAVVVCNNLICIGWINAIQDKEIVVDVSLIRRNSVAIHSS